MITREEQETIITFSPVEDYVNIYTDMPGMIRKYKKMLDVPGVRLIRQTKDALEIAVEKERVSVTIRRPYNATPEQREKARERMQKLRNAQNS